MLVTGGLGFIGSSLAHRLVELGARVTLVDSLIPAYGGNLWNIRGIEDRVRVNITDVRDPHSMSWLVRDQQYLFNLAGQVSHVDSMRDPETDLDINCRAQLSILEACRRNNPEIRIVYASTRQQYGRPQYLPVDENHLLQPVDVNGINKMAGEWYHILYSRVHGIPTTSLRLTNTYGPRMLLKHDRQGFVPWFVRLALLGEEIRIFGDGTPAPRPQLRRRRRGGAPHGGAGAGDGRRDLQPRPSGSGLAAGVHQGAGRRLPGEPVPAGAVPRRTRRSSTSATTTGASRRSAPPSAGSPGSTSRRGCARTVAYYRDNLAPYLE